MFGFLRRFLAITSIASLVAFFVSSRPVCGQSVWSGFSHSFAKFDFADQTLPANQDRITNNVWITRGTQQGIYNIHDEASYSSSPPGSPIGTRWATALNNPGKTIAATNWSNLVFSDWVTAYGGQGATTLPINLLNENAVVLLENGNIYLDLRFTAWTSHPGGGFAYERAPAPPPSTTGDYNLNGVVDAADYVVWRDTLSQTVSPLGSGADGNANGTIDSGDFDLWRGRFGNTVGIGTEVSGFAVPEPGCFSYLALAGCCRTVRRRKR